MRIIGPQRTLVVLYGPNSALVQDVAGNLYGSSLGDVFKLAPDGTFTVLYAFSGGRDGQEPTGVIRDRKGYLYGVTSFGGDPNCGFGTVFELNPNGVLVHLHTFTGGNDGAIPAGALLRESGGELYGVTLDGGGNGCGGAACGTIFKVHQILLGIA